MLWVPDSFELKLPALKVVTILSGRLQIGESLRRTTFDDVKRTGVPQYRRAVRRWQGANYVIVDSLLRETATQPAGSVAAGVSARAAPSTLEQEFEEINDELSRDVTRLSMLRFKIAIDEGLPIDDATPSEVAPAE